MIAPAGGAVFGVAFLRDDDVVAPLTAHTALARWEFAPLVAAIVAAAALLYLVGVVVVRRRRPSGRWPWRWTASFLTGLAVIVVATQSSIGAYDDVLFWMHMVQHLLLLMVAPPLLILGRPATLLLHATRNPVHTRVKRVLRSRVVTAVTFPLLGAGLYALTVVGTHLTGFMNLVLVHPLVHDLEHAWYLVAGYLYFLPVIGREPIRWRLTFPARLFLLLVAMPVDTLTGVVLGQANHELFPAYAGRRDWGPSLVADLHDGGAWMWIGGDFLMVVMLIALFAQVARSRQPLTAGRWLESARANILGHVPNADTDPDGGQLRNLEPDSDAALAAYNAHLARLAHQQTTPAHQHTPGEQP